MRELSIASGTSSVAVRPASTKNSPLETFSVPVPEIVADSANDRRRTEGESVSSETDAPDVAKRAPFHSGNVAPSSQFASLNAPDAPPDQTANEDSSFSETTSTRASLSRSRERLNPPSVVLSSTNASIPHSAMLLMIV